MHPADGNKLPPAQETAGPAKIGRRRFTKQAAATLGASLGFHFIPSRAWGNVEKPVLAAIGAGGKGRADIAGSAGSGFQVRALVDVVNPAKLSSSISRPAQG